MWGRNKLTAVNTAVILLLVPLIRSVGAVNLYPFENHQKLSEGDQQSVVVHLNTTFTFLQRKYTQLRVSVVYCSVIQNIKLVWLISSCPCPWLDCTNEFHERESMRISH